jgi:hypothetical protein
METQEGRATAGQRAGQPVVPADVKRRRKAVFELGDQARALDLAEVADRDPMRGVVGRQDVDLPSPIP